MAGNFKLPNLDHEEIILFGGNMEPQRLTVKRGISHVVVSEIKHQKIEMRFNENCPARPALTSIKYQRLTGTNLFYPKKERE